MGGDFRCLLSDAYFLYKQVDLCGDIQHVLPQAIGRWVVDHGRRGINYLLLIIMYCYCRLIIIIIICFIIIFHIHYYYYYYCYDNMMMIVMLL